MPTRPDADLIETLDLLSRVTARIATQVDDIAKAQASDIAMGESVARFIINSTQHAVTSTLRPDLQTMAADVRAIRHAQTAPREGFWDRFYGHPLAITLGIPLLLVTVLALTVPRAAAQTGLTCWVAGGSWYPPSDRHNGGCIYVMGPS